MGKLSLTIFVGMTIFLSGCLLTTKQANQTDVHLTQVVATTSAYQKEREEYVAAILNTSTWRVFVDEDNGVRFKYPAVFTHLERRKDRWSGRSHCTDYNTSCPKKETDNVRK